LVVYDEAHRLKNREGVGYSIADAIVTKRRIALTGTPVQNNLQELWSTMEFVKKGFLGNYDRFETDYKDPIEVVYYVLRLNLAQQVTMITLCFRKVAGKMLTVIRSI
jgi:hypothetical protein